MFQFNLIISIIITWLSFVSIFIFRFIYNGAIISYDFSVIFFVVTGILSIISLIKIILHKKEITKGQFFTLLILTILPLLLLIPTSTVYIGP